MKLPNPKVKWELIRKAKKLRDDTGFDGIYINPDLTPEQWKLQFETRNKLRELRQSNPLKQFRIKSGRIVETPQSLAWQITPLKILSWNVGLNSTLELNGSNYLEEHDIFQLSETLMIQNPVIRNFLVFDVPAVKQQHGRPMRGLAICIKTHLCSKFTTRHFSTDSLVISLPDIRTSLLHILSSKY